MPLVLFLQDTFNALKKGLKKIEKWPEMLFLEEVVIARARTAFLVKWFGTRIPMRGRHVRVGIANLAALRWQRDAILAARVPANTGPNLTEPLAGLTGTLAGIALSPTGATLITFGILKAITNWSQWYLVILLGLGSLILAPIAFLVTGSIFGLLTALGPAVAFFGVLQLPRMTERLYRLVGHMTVLIQAAMRFFAQLVGPRSGVRNPLVRRILEVLDQVAMLLPHVVGLVAVVMTRGGLVLRSLIPQLPLLFDLTRQVLETVAYILTDLINSIGEFVVGRNSPVRAVQFVIGRISWLVGLLKDVFTIMFGDHADRFRNWWDGVQEQIQAWAGTTMLVALASLLTSPVIQTILVALGRFRLAARLYQAAARRAPSSASSGSSGSGMWGHLLGAGRALIGYFSSSGSSPFTPPDLPDPNVIALRAGRLLQIPLTPGTVGIGTGVRGLGRLLGLVDDPFALSQRTRDALQRARYPRSVFARERRRLRDAQGRSAEEQLRALRQQELPYRNRLYQIIYRIFPPSGGPWVASLDDVFRGLDRYIYQDQIGHEALEYPVRALLETRRLRPVVHTLRVRAAGSDQSTVEAWSGRLQTAFQAQTYLAPE